MDLEEMSCQENCTPPDQIERKKKRKRDASDKGEVNRSEFSEGISLVVDSGEGPTADSVSLVHEDAPLLNGSKTKRKDKKKKKGKKKQEVEATNLSNSTMSADGPSFVSRDSEGSSEPVTESNIPLSKGKKRKKKKEKQDTAVTDPNNINMPAEGPNSVLQELNENTGSVCKSKKKKKKKKEKKKKREEEAIEQHNSNKSAGADSSLLELNEKTDVTNGRLNKEKKKKKKKKKQKHEVVNPNDSGPSVEGPGPLLPELNVKTELVGESNNSVGKKRRKKRQKTEDIDSGYIGAHDEALTSGHQNGVLEGTTVCLEKDQELGGPLQAAPAIASVEGTAICLEEKAGLTDCLENTKLCDQCEGITAVVSIGNTSTLETQEHRNNEVLQVAKHNTCQSLVECLATTICNHEAEHPEHKITNEDTDIKDIDLPASEGMVSKDVKLETIKLVEPRPILSRFVDTNDTQISKKKLLILDLNGLLVDVVPCYSGRRKPDMVLSRKYVFRRPFVDDFLKFCFNRFAVAIWSSRTRKNIDPLIKFLFGNSRKKLVFRWNQFQCTRTKFMTLENKDKPLVLKELRKVWKKLEPDLPFEKGEYNELNTLLLDDSPYKALRNPANTAVFPYSYQYDVEEDNSLGPGGDLRVYLENLALAENIPEYVKQNPFGQSAITSSDPSWHFYEEVLKEEQRRKRPRHSRWDC